MQTIHWIRGLYSKYIRNSYNSRSKTNKQEQKTKTNDLKIGKGPEYAFFQRRYTTDQRYVKRYSTSLILREMQIKTTIRYHFAPVRMSITKNK